MKPVNKIDHHVTGVTFIVALNDFADDYSTVKFMLTEDNKKICYLEFVANTLKEQGCLSYNVLVDVPIANYNLVHTDKSSHSKESWNEKLTQY